MSKIDTVDKLTLKLDKTLAWRKKELITLHSHAHSNPDNCHLHRAIFPMICAHYEGFLKEAACLYLTHISDLELPLNTLKSVFTPLLLSSEFSACKESKRTTVRSKVFCEYEKISDQPLSISNPRIFIDTESNPTPDVLTEILESLAIEVTPFQTKFNFINDSLLKNRHAIVHGERLDINYQELHTVLNTTLDIIELLKNQLIDSATNMRYKK